MLVRSKMATYEVATLKESPLSPWGAASRLRSRSEGRPLALLADATPRAQKLPSEEIGCISYVNTLVSEVGLQRTNILPPLIFSLYTPHLIGREHLEREAMAHRRGKIVKKKKVTKTYHHDHKPPVSKHTKVPIKDIDFDDTIADTLLVELATYPGFNPHFPTPLPHKMDTLEQMKRVTSAQTKLSTKIEGYREAWRQLFYSLPSQAIFLDYYWWFFLHRYQTNQLATQDLLFSRISNNYVKMICEPVEMKWKDSFFKMYPDVLAQCVYSTFIHGYPNSWNSFDERFKTELCQFISLWQVGTKPIPNSWSKWELHLLEPPNLLKHVGEDSDDQEPKKAGRFDLDELVRDVKEKEIKLSEKSVSTLESQHSSTSHVSSQMSHSSSSHVSAQESHSSSSQKKLSFMDVKKALSGSADTLVPLVRHSKNQHMGQSMEGLVPSVSEEKRIGIVMEQFSNLEMSKFKHETKLTPLSHPGSDPKDEKEASSKDVHTQTGYQVHFNESNPPSKAHQPSILRPSSVQTSGFKEERSQKPSNKHRKHSAIPNNKTDSAGQKRPKPVRNESTDSAGQKQPKPVRNESTDSAGQKRKPVRNESNNSAGQKQPKPVQSESTVRQSTTSTVKGHKSIQSASTERNQRHSKSVQSERRSTISTNKIGTVRGQKQSKSVHSESTGATTGTKQTGELKKIALAFKNRPKGDSSATIKGPEFEHVLFNLYGHSPLVRHYMNNLNMTHVKEKEIVVGRTEISEEPPHDAVCYRDILFQSKLTGKANRALFERHYMQQKRLMAHADKKRIAAAQKHEKNVKLVLANRKEVQQLSNQLAIHALQSKHDKDNRVVSTAINRTLQRIKEQ